MPILTTIALAIFVLEKSQPRITERGTAATEGVTPEL
jgi:hypothetical protein